MPLISCGDGGRRVARRVGGGVGGAGERLHRGCLGRGRGRVVVLQVMVLVIVVLVVMVLVVMVVVVFGAHVWQVQIHRPCRCARR